MVDIVCFVGKLYNVDPSTGKQFDHTPLFYKLSAAEYRRKKFWLKIRKLKRFIHH